jgi:hypothetical protein
VTTSSRSDAVATSACVREPFHPALVRAVEAALVEIVRCFDAIGVLGGPFLEVPCSLVLVHRGVGPSDEIFEAF